MVKKRFDNAFNCITIYCITVIYKDGYCYKANVIINTKRISEYCATIIENIYIPPYQKFEPDAQRVEL